MARALTHGPAHAGSLSPVKALANAQLSFLFAASVAPCVVRPSVAPRTVRPSAGPRAASLPAAPAPGEARP